MDKKTASLALAAALAAGCADIGNGAKEITVAEMKPGDSKCGFVLKSIEELPETGGRMWRMEYAKNGAELAWFQRPDENKTFAIAFRTLSGDDTGVPHIIEHSVLCGSAKYPVKEPFVDLLKSSLYTFLNAYTSKDQTVYPVSSRNGRDFQNLVGVYLDAVFHPRSAENPVMFRQEGWHYEFGKDGKLVRNGVVYNEMKGTYANPESVAFREICKLLFPESFYRFDSGGDPEHIGELTFEKYREFYLRHYHPSNSRIFLDGDIDIDKTLAILDSYLSAYERRNDSPEIAPHRPVERAASVPYAIGKDESPEGKTLLSEAWVFGDYDDTVKSIAFDVLSDVLAGSNEAPLKKALLDKGLCEDVELDSFSFRQLCAFLFAKNVPDGKADEFRRTVRETLSALADGGLPADRLSASLDRHEFSVRELFSGGGTCGVQFANMALDHWLYGGNPADAFRAADAFAFLRENLSKSWFEKFLRETLVANPHHASLEMTPDATLAAKRLAAEEAELAKTLAGWSDAEKERVKAETAAVDAFRDKKDTPEELATLPRLSPADIPARGKERSVRSENIGGVETIYADTGAKGVFYATLAFSLDDLDDGELARVPFLADVLGELATSKRSALELKSALDSGLGFFKTSVKTYAAAPGDTANARAILSVETAALESKAGEMARLVPEVLLETSFSDAKAIAGLMKQNRLDIERKTSTIHARILARRRAAAPFSANGAAEEIVAGLEQLRHMQKAEKDFAADPAAAMAEMEALAKKIFAKGRLVAIVSSNLPADGLRPLLEAFPEGAAGKPVRRAAPPPRREGFTVAAESAYAAKGSHLSAAGAKCTGSELVAARILSLAYLWDEIRVKGGAYGGGLQISADGNSGFLSWRDPNPARSLECYSKAPAVLRDIARGEAPIDRYIVGTIGAVDPCITPRQEVSLAEDLHFSGRTFEDLQRMRGEILATGKKDLLRVADVLERLDSKSSICVIGGAAGVASCSNSLDTVEAVVAK